jgi:cobalt transport protein ATP-binding subunit
MPPITHKEITKTTQTQFEPGDELLSVTGLRYAYHGTHEALKGVSLSIGKGEKVALVGPNGAGKSTLMLHLNGILRDKNKDPNIVISGMPMTKENLPYIRAKVGVVFQNPDDQLFSPTVFEDVAFGPLHMGYEEDEVRRRVEHALSLVGMSTYADRLSHHLSGGEKKRAAIATVLSMDPDILVLDEPSAALDPRSRRSLIELLQELPITMLVSTHDMLMVREIFPRMIIMDHGEIVADGPTDVLMDDQALLVSHGLERPY